MEENITTLHTFHISELQMDYSDLETRLEDVEETQNGTPYELLFFVYLLNLLDIIDCRSNFVETLILLD